MVVSPFTPRTSMSSSTVPDTFDMPALGRHARLGELYCPNIQDFIHIPLYSDIKDDDKQNIPVGYTNFKLSMSNTLEEKTSTMDISASLAIEVLSGLVKVEGSGSYLKDSKGNIEQQCFAMSLLKHVNQERLLFEESKVDGKKSKAALEIIRTDPRTPTHFVSSIVYGGSVVINLQSIRTKLEEVESIKGELSVELQKLKGMVSLSGKGAVDLEGNLKKLNDKFELSIYGDFTLDAPKLPKDLKEILEFVPDAAKAIGNGVPIIYTLQRIPSRLVELAAITHELENTAIRQITTACAQLDDVRARFDTVRDSSRSNKVLIPRLYNTVDKAYQSFRKEYEALLLRLQDFLKSYKKDGPTDTRTDTLSKLIKDIVELVNKHLSPTKTTAEVLATVEGPCHDFEDLAHVAELAGHRFIPIPNTPGVQNLFTTIVNLDEGDTIGLFLIPPLAHPVKVDTFSAASTLIRVGRAVYSKLKMNNYLCFAEDKESRGDLQDILTKDPFFDTFDSPTAIRVTKTDDGAVTWKQESFDKLNLTVPQPLCSFEPGLDVRNAMASLIYDIPNFAYNQSFTFIVEGLYAGHYNSKPGDFVAITTDGLMGSPGYYFFLSPDGRPNLEFSPRSMAARLAISSGKNPLAHDKDFSLAFVQKIKDKEETWSLYVNGLQEGGEKAKRPFDGDVETFKLCRRTFPLGYADVLTTYGNLYRIRVYQKALTQDEIKKELEEPKSMTASQNLG